MSLNYIKGLAGEIGTTYAHRMQQEMVQDKMNYVVSDDNFVKVKCNITPSLVKSFYEAKEAMERQEEESKLLQAQLQNKRLRAMVKKVIFSGDRTIIMWNDGTKTVTQCHELDVYDKEKGILACMAKKLYENTNLFNEVIQEYVDFETEVPRTIVDSYMVDIDSLEILDTLKEYKHYTKCLEEDLENEHLNRTEMENIYYSLQTQYDAYVKKCSLYQDDIKLLQLQVASRDEQIEELEAEIRALEEERNLLQDELDNVTPYDNYY